MAESTKKSPSGKCKKAGRNEAKCKRYFNAGRREKNKIHGLLRHLKVQPRDNIAVASLNVTKRMLKGERAWKKRAA